MKALKLTLVPAIFFVLFMFGISIQSAASTDSTWKENIEISSDNLLDVTWGKDCFVAVGTNGIVMRSADGRNWTKIKTAASGNIKSILWFGDRFVGSTDKGEILVSADGSKWVKSIPYKSLSYGVMYKAGNKIVITSKQGDLVSSSDCISWKSAKSVLTGANDIEYNGKIYVAIGDDKVFKSFDGFKWTSCGYGLFNAVTTKDGRFFAITGHELDKIDGGYYTSTLVYVSDNGENWSQFSRMDVIWNNDILWDGKTFIFGGRDTNYHGEESQTGFISTSMDCLKCNTKEIKSTYDFNRVYFNGSTYIAVGDKESIAISKDGQNWESISTEAKPLITDVASNGSIFVGTGKDGTVYTSNDGFKWNKVKTENDMPFNKVIWSGNLFYVVSSEKNWGEGIVITSPDGVNWTSHPIYRELNDVAWNGNLEAGVGYYDTVQICKDGWNWGGINLEDNLVDEVSCIKWSGSKFVIAGGSGIIAYSYDGLKWNTAKIGKFDNINDIEWNGNMFTAVGYNPYSGDQGNNQVKKALILTSKDGINWTRKEFDNCYQLNSVIWDGNEFVVSGNNGIIMTSSTGSNWSVQGTETGQNIIKLEFINNRTIALTQNSAVLFKDGKYKHYIPAYLKKSEVKYEYDWKKADIKSLNQPHINHVVWNGSIFVATTGSDEVLTSPDGMKWQGSKVGEGIETLNIVHDGSEFILLAGNTEGNGSYIYTSKDGLEWEKTNLETDEYVDLLAANSSTIIALAQYSRTIYKSNDSINWISYKAPESNYAGSAGIFESDGILYLVYGASEIYTSIDGEKWKKSGINGPQAKPVSNGDFKIYYFNDPFGGAFLYKSTDGKAWTKLCGPYEQPGNMVWNGREFISVSNFGKVTRSADGIEWVYDKPIDEVNIFDLAWNGYTLVTVCNNGNIYYAIPKSIIKVKMNGKPLQMENSPIVLNNRTMIPFRKILEVCGAQVQWNEKDRTVTAVKGSDKIVLRVDNEKALLNNEEQKLDTPPVIVNNRTYVPLRFISEALGYEVKWIEETKTVEINEKLT